jgi:hypothetical protein
MERRTMTFDFGSLLVAFLVSGAGFVLFSYGRRMQRMPQVVAGIVLMVGPYFVPSVLGTLAFGVAVAALLFGALFLGW